MPRRMSVWPVAIQTLTPLGIGIGVGIVALALVIIAFQLGGSSKNASAAAGNAFYTDDSGKTFFRDDAAKVSPFDHNGKQAYRCDVFKGADGKKFAGLIYRHTDTGRQEMQSYILKKSADVDGSTRRAIEQRGMQVKRVADDDNAWQANDDVTTERLQSSVKDASGKPAQLVNP